MVLERYGRHWPSASRHRAWARLGVLAVGIVSVGAMGWSPARADERATTRPARTSLAIGATPWPSLVYARPGVALVGISPVGSGNQGTRPSQLYLSTDMVHWKDVTPPGSDIGDHGGYEYFEHASFLSASTGWVTSWNPGTDGVMIYRTTDAGSSWTAVAGGDHGASAGDTILYQPVSNTTAFRELLVPTGPTMALQVSTNDGRTWRSAYKAPSGSPGVQPKGPGEIPMVFIDARHGFAIDGIPPTEQDVSNAAHFFFTSDGGAIWTSKSPPLPQTRSPCPSGVDPSSNVSCLFGAPTFSDAEDGVLAAAVVSSSRASVMFDVTDDGGLTWSARSQRTVLFTANTEPGDSSYPLVSAASAAWWLVGWTATGITTQVTTDTGSHWKVSFAPHTGGVPVALAALDAAHAVLTVQAEMPDGTVTHLLATANGGRSWSTLSFPR